MDSISHLYIHIPFCSRRCDYCDFYSEAGKEELLSPYVSSLLAEAHSYAGELRQVETLYLGGGTPTMLGPERLQDLLEGLDALLSPGVEISVEANPGLLDARLAAAIRAAGINRISLGVQSFSSRLRKNLGRYGGEGEIEDKVALLRREGLVNISIDLIFGIPEQGKNDLENDIQRALELAPEHISYYELSVREGSSYESRWLKELEEARRQGADSYRLVVDRLEAAGYRWYETSNFALPGYECAHNLAYWAGRDYLGLGAGAWSTVGNRRWRNVEDIGLYLDARDNLELSMHREELSKSQKAEEILFLGLRLAGGVSGERLREVMNPAAAKYLLENGFLANDGGRIRLTRPGRMMADDICARLLRE